MRIDYEGWLSGSRSGSDPTDWNGSNPICDIIECQKEIEQNDTYCEDHQRCVMCGDNDDCECEDEYSNTSACCDATFYDPGYPDNDICSSCKEHSTSAWQEALEDAAVSYAIKSVKELPGNNLFQDKNKISNILKNKKQ